MATALPTPIGPKYDVSVTGTSEAEFRRFVQENFKQIFGVLFGYGPPGLPPSDGEANAQAFALMMMD